MAVAKDIALEEEEIAEGPAEEEPLMGDEDNEAGSETNDEPIESNDAEVEGSQINRPQRLSREAVKLLMRASRCVMKRSAVITQRPSTIRGKLRRSSRSAAGRHHQQILLDELQSLRDLIPSSLTFGDIDSQPCVIRDALGYLKSLRREIESLNEDLVKTLMNSVALDAKVEINNNKKSLEINVSCCKRRGLLADIMLALESMGLVFDEVNISCNHRLLLHASSTQEGLHLLDDDAIKEAIWTALCRY